MNCIPSLLIKFHYNFKMSTEVRVNLNMKKFLNGCNRWLDKSEFKGINSTNSMKMSNNKFVFTQRTQSILFQEIRFLRTKLIALLLNKKSVSETITFRNQTNRKNKKMSKKLKKVYLASMLEKKTLKILKKTKSGSRWVTIKQIWASLITRYKHGCSLNNLMCLYRIKRWSLRDLLIALTSWNLFRTEEVLKD